MRRRSEAELLSVPLQPFLGKAQSSILACRLIAEDRCLPKAVEVAFFQLFSVNDMGNELSETSIAERGSVIVRPPRNDSVFFPLFTTLDALYA